MARTLAWALFLAVSWTWCIGMHLPNLLARDGGLPFFFAFFIPNVLGAASVGFVLRTRDRSSNFVRSLRTPMLLFSAVTVAFQAYFLAWKMTEDLAVGVLHMPAGIACGVTLVGVTSLLRGRVDWVPALVTLLCTITAGALLISQPIELIASEPIASLIGLSMVTMLGFGICPYLDLSFNRAVQHAPNPRAAFAIGFFVVFAAIILMATHGRAIWTPNAAPFEMRLDWVFGAMGLHFGAQATFTIFAHTAAVYATSKEGSIAGDAEPVDAGAEGRPSLRRWIFLPVLAGLLIGAGTPFIPMRVDLPGFASSIDPTEFTYRLFLGFYGLVFPVWTLVALRRPGSTDRSTLIWLAAVCAVAGPFLWVGSIGRDEAWLIPGVAIVLLAGAYRSMTRPHATN